MAIMKMEIDINRIKSEMAQKGINQSKLAELVGISKQLMSLWIKNPRSINLENVGLIADALGIDARDLIVFNLKREQSS